MVFVLRFTLLVIQMYGVALRQVTQLDLLTLAMQVPPQHQKHVILSILIKMYKLYIHCHMSITLFKSITMFLWD